ncbi:hypothetical protein [Geodermatophilus sp. SYSU D01119]
MDLDAPAAYLVGPDWSRPRKPLIYEGDLDARDLSQGLATPTGPIPFRVPSSARPADILFADSVALHVVSAKVIDILERHELTGWRSYPVTGVGPHGALLNGYAGLAITGRTGPPDYSNIQVIMRPLGPVGVPEPHYRGLHPQRDTWDGSDLFVIEGRLGLCITAAAKDALTQAQLAQPLPLFERLCDVETWISPH